MPLTGWGQDKPWVGNIWCALVNCTASECMSILCLAASLPAGGSAAVSHAGGGKGPDDADKKLCVVMT